MSWGEKMSSRSFLTSDRFIEMNMATPLVGRLSRLSSRMLFHRNFLPSASSRAFHETQFCCKSLSQKADRQKKRRPRRSKRRSSFERKSGSSAEESQVSKKKGTPLLSSGKEKETDNIFLRLASEWTHPSSEASQHPHVRQIWDQMKAGKATV